MRWCRIALTLATALGVALCEGSGEGEEPPSPPASAGAALEGEFMPVNATPPDARRWDYRDPGETLDYTQKPVLIFQVIGDRRYYLDTSSFELALYKTDSEAPPRALDFILYNIQHRERDEDGNQVVLRNRLNGQYLCLTQCGLYRVTPSLTYDCVFVWETVHGDVSPETFRLRKRYGDELMTVNVENGQVNFYRDAVLFSEDLDDDGEDRPLTPLLDEADASPCREEDQLRLVADGGDGGPADGVVVSAGFALVTLPIVLACLAVAVVTVAALLWFVMFHKNRGGRFALRGGE